MGLFNFTKLDNHSVIPKLAFITFFLHIRIYVSCIRKHINTKREDNPKMIFSLNMRFNCDGTSYTLSFILAVLAFFLSKI